MLERVDSLLYTVAGGTYTDENVVKRAPTHIPTDHAESEKAKNINLDENVTSVAM